MEQHQGEAIPTQPGATADLADAAAARSYSYRVEGLDEAEAAPLLARFRSLSTLEEYRGNPANAAQIDRRARADAELMGELLRSHGYYDALVTTDVAAAGTDGFAVTLSVQPGPLYHFTMVLTPGLEQAVGADAAALRQSFAVSERDPVNAETVQNAEAALRVELGRRGYAFAEVAEPEIVVDHETQTATLVLPVETAGARRFGHVLVEGRPSAPIISKRSRASTKAILTGPTGSRICARRWSPPDSSRRSRSGRLRGRAPTSSTSPSRWSPRRCAPSPARPATAPARACGSSSPGSIAI